VFKGKMEPQAVGKVLLEKPVPAEALELSLGRVWCFLKGVECRNLGENRFLFTFLHASGERQVPEDGPWMFGKDLVVMADFDGNKTIDEVVFAEIPIWVRIMKMPLGMMNKRVREMIGDLIGEVLDVDVDDQEMVIGQFLRVKVRLDIKKPLMRGVTLDMGGGWEGGDEVVPSCL
jgi:hypothetical protein